MNNERNILLVVKESFFSFQFLYVGYVLGYLDNALIFTVIVAQYKVSDVDEFSSHLHPELCFVTCSVLEGFHDFFHYVKASWGVAAFYLSSYDAWASGEYSFLALGVIDYSVVLIYECDVDG